MGMCDGLLRYCHCEAKGRSNPPVTARHEAVHFSAVQLRHLDCHGLRPRNDKPRVTASEAKQSIPVTARHEAVHDSAVQLRHLWIAAAYGLAMTLDCFATLAMTSPCHCEERSSPFVTARNEAIC